jgi:tannase/feruloyl esterase
MGNLRKHATLLSVTVGAGLGAVALFAAEPAQAALPKCSVAILNGYDVPNVTIESALDVPATSPNPEYCQIVGSLMTTGEGAPTGSALFLLRIPVAWNNRFVFMGCGGSCGSIGTVSAITGIYTPSLSVNGVDSAKALSLGYAIVNTDTGHENIPGQPDPTWKILASGARNLAGYADFYYRSVHEVAEAAKELVQAYEDADIEYSYFDGCSTGGRQAVVSADRYPDDFDGIIAGDPVIDLDNIKVANMKEVRSFLPTNAFISNATVASLDAAVLANCDAADGVADGLIQNPAACTINPNSLVGTVLTQPQADGITLYLSQIFDTRGNYVYPGMSIGHWATTGFSAIQEFGNAPAPFPTSAEPWGARGIGPVVWTLGDPGIRYDTENNPNFDTINSWPQGPPFTTALNIVTTDDVKLLEQTAGDGDGDDPAKMREFIRHGGKMILYHGFADPLVSPYRTIWLYRELAERAQEFRDSDRDRDFDRDRDDHDHDFDRDPDSDRDYQEIQENVRLFMVPGMGHCAGGTAPNSFDTLNTLVDWVENGVAPDSLPATNTLSGRSMPLCKFPEEADYIGGPTNLASSWTCDPRDRRLLTVSSNGKLAGADHNAARNDH